MGARHRVVVVGAGPGGLVAAIVLGRLGVDVLVLERRPTGSALARATTISTRSMEIFRSWGLEHQIRRGAAEVEPLGWETFSLSAGEGTVVPLGYPTADQARQVSPTGPAWAPQDHLEPLLVGLVRRLPNVELRLGSELVALHDADDHIVACVEGSNSRREVLRADYLIGADGAHSSVRALAGMTMCGPDNMGEFHRVEFRAPLRDVIGEHRYGLYIIRNADAASIMAPQGAGDRWMLAREWHGPTHSRLIDADESSLQQLVATAAGVRGLPAKIERTNAFFFSAQIADRYRTNRVFIVGDAAHRMTPRGGTGMNTAIQDGFDLAWKLAWVLHGWAAESLLDTYEAERRPVGIHNVERSARVDGARQELDDALPWDLNGRLTHCWIDPDQQTVSSLDLLGDGFTLLTGPEELQWSQSRLTPPWHAPLTIHQLDHQTAKTLAIGASGAVLVRPDGKIAGRWSQSQDELRPQVPVSDTTQSNNNFM